MGRGAVPISQFWVPRAFRQAFGNSTAATAASNIMRPALCLVTLYAGGSSGTLSFLDLRMDDWLASPPRGDGAAPSEQWQPAVLQAESGWTDMHHNA